MPWKRFQFKRAKVWVQIDGRGEPVLTNRTVTLCYKKGDAKTYNGSIGNLMPLKEADILTDDEWLEAVPAEKPAKKTKTADPAKPQKELPNAAVAPVPETRDPKHLHMFTDGACSGNPGPAGLGVLIQDGKEEFEISLGLGEATNNIAELAAIQAALLYVIDKKRPAHIYTDSSYSIGVLTQGWKAKANPELILDIRELIAEFEDITFHKVKGHSGIPENERADQLAVAGINN